MWRTILIILVLLIVGSVFAQDDVMPQHIVSAWEQINLDPLLENDNEPFYVAFLQIDADTLLEVARGADVVYTRNEDGTYSGATLLPVPYEFSSTLTIIDEDTYEVFSSVTSGTFTSETDLRYERQDFNLSVWVEPERDLQEFSLFQECMGRVDVSPPTAFSDPDPILPIVFDDELGVMRLGDTLLIGGGDAYELEEERPFGQFMQIIVQSAMVSEDVIDFEYNSIADGRDDCELRYQTQYILFDMDYEALYTRVDAMSTEDE